ncbi:MAG: NAD(P)-binding protein [Elusimicrobia bacterium]|nr:NAD(P)-binding protein [Elusimicrobiota bacterium]
MKRKTLIIGAGLSGLSCAFFLKKSGKDFFLAEKKEIPGGLASSFNLKGFTFDYSGHLLHLRWPDTSCFIKKLLKDNIVSLERKASIYHKGNYVPYPFQANLWALDSKDRNYCVREYLKTFDHSKKGHKDFKSWALSVFGKGICEYFMLSYNEKLWKNDLSKMSLEWLGNFLPVPNPSQILKGAYGKNGEIFGYNGSFFYPKKGGIGYLPQILSKSCGKINYTCEVLKINSSKKYAVTSNGLKISYDLLVNTSPLKEFIFKIKDAPDKIYEAAEKLKSNKVFILNLGLKRKVSPYHWIYFPQKDFPFYRLGFYDNFSPFCAPEGKGAAYAEFALKETENLNKNRAFEKTAESLIKIGILKSEEEIEQYMWLEVPNAYAFYDFERKKTLKIITDWLESKKIFSIGRYGAWKYSFMEENIKDGKETAQKILNI